MTEMIDQIAATITCGGNNAVTAVLKELRVPSPEMLGGGSPGEARRRAK